MAAMPSPRRDGDNTCGCGNYPSRSRKPRSFVVLGGKGVEERKFDTLAEAVQGASDGDTIEIRGNGPFVSEPIKSDETRSRSGPARVPAGHSAKPGT